MEKTQGEVNQEYVKRIENQMGAAFMQVINTAFRENEKIGKLSQRLGRLVSKFDTLDVNNMAFLAWVEEYKGIKSEIQEIGEANSTRQKEVMEFHSKQNIALGLQSLQLMTNSREHYSRLYAKIEVLDDFIAGLIENLSDNVHLEIMQREKIEKVMKAAIEKTKELPSVMYG